MPPTELPDALRGVKALTFDVFGTTVDWRSTVEAELAERARSKAASSSAAELQQTPALARLAAQTADDWAAFAQAWRDSYSQFTQTFVPGITPWKDIDSHHLDSLRELLQAHGLEGAYTDAEVRDLSLVWHRLRPWADSTEGLRRLTDDAGLVTTTLSNGNRELLGDLAAHGGLGFSRITSAADFSAYKPDPRVYRGAVAALGFEDRPGDVAMVAAHLNDLAGARACGLRTIYIERPREEAWGPDEDRYKEARDWVDMWVREGEGGFLEVARRLGGALTR